MSCLLLIILIFISKCSATNILSSISKISFQPFEEIEDHGRSFGEVANENGYMSETHEVTTADGYILTVHRIPPGRNCTKKAPVLIVHGLLLASEVFLAGGHEASGYVFAKECYDVWFGNVRGNFHSRRHVTLNPDKDIEFWKFSFDQMGLYDVPAMIDLVLSTTKSKKLIYVGYSQGGASFFVMNSEKPEYTPKVSLFVGLAPSTRLLHTKSVFYRKAAVSVNTLKAPLEAAGVWEIRSKGFPVQGVLGTLCKEEFLAATLCGTATSLIDSPHPDSVTPEIEKRLYQYAPAGTSVQNFAHFGQCMNNEKFTKFNHGPEENMRVYGSIEPPVYDLEAVTVPTVIYHGASDHLVDTKDIDWTVDQLPNVLDYITVEDPLWNHVDMACSRYWNDAIFVTMKKYLAEYDGC